MFKLLDNSLLFVIDFETFGKLSFWTILSRIWSAFRTELLQLWEVPFALNWTSGNKLLHSECGWNYCSCSIRIMVPFSLRRRYYLPFGRLLPDVFGSTALAICLHLFEAMPARLTTRTPLSFQLKSHGCRCLLGFRHLWHVSTDPLKSFPRFQLLYSQQTLVASCQLLVAIAKLWMSQSNGKCCQFWHHARSKWVFLRGTP